MDEISIKNMVMAERAAAKNLLAALAGRAVQPYVKMLHEVENNENTPEKAAFLQDMLIEVFKSLKSQGININL